MPEVATDPGLIQWLIMQGGGYALAGLCLWIMKMWHDDTVKRNNERAADEMARNKELLDRERQDKSILVDTLTRNTDSNTRLTEVIMALDRHMGNLTKKVDNIT